MKLLMNHGDRVNVLLGTWDKSAINFTARKVKSMYSRIFKGSYYYFRDKSSSCMSISLGSLNRI